jgi:hypothetical protein
MSLRNPLKGLLPQVKRIEDLIILIDQHVEEVEEVEEDLVVERQCQELKKKNIKTKKEHVGLEETEELEELEEEEEAIEVKVVIEVEEVIEDIEGTEAIERTGVIEENIKAIPKDTIEGVAHVEAHLEMVLQQRVKQKHQQS